MAAWRQGSVHALSGVPAVAAGSMQQSSQRPGHRRVYFILLRCIVMFADPGFRLAECAVLCISVLTQIPCLTALKNINVIPVQSR